jgi:hypothetical protein
MKKKLSKCRCSKTLLRNAKFFRAVCSHYGRGVRSPVCDTKIWLQKDVRVRGLCEILYNMCTGNVPLSRQTVDELRQYEPQLRVLLKSRLPMTERKRIINQTGGLVPLVIQAALPLVVDFIRKSL